MGRPALTEYLLKLATDGDEYNGFVGGDTPGKIERMEKAGLNGDQCDAVLSGDAKLILAEVMEELECESSSKEKFSGNTLAIILPMDHIQHHLLLENLPEETA
ncbi:MAG: hypothetical protein WA814_04895 [Candidatus Baltobacteraceae bacterium]